MPTDLRGAALLSLLALIAGCSGSKSPASDAKRTLEPERRFGNDPELVADFANLKTCVYRDGRLDYSCDNLQTLKRRLRVKTRKPDRRAKVVVTLANLLESRRELTRLVAADSLFPHHRQPKIVAALREALQVEQVPTVKATMLRQACWGPSDWSRTAALKLLAPDEPPPVQVEAAVCLGRQQKGEVVVRALVASLDGARPPAVRGQACAALGALGAVEATAAMAARLDDAADSTHCVPALAQLGTREAHDTLIKAARAALAAGKLLPQYPAALAAAAARPFFERDTVAQLLAEAASGTELPLVTRLRAVRELADLGDRTRLAALQTKLGGKKPENAQPVLEEIRRQLER